MAAKNKARKLLIDITHEKNKRLHEEINKYFEKICRSKKQEKKAEETGKKYQNKSRKKGARILENKERGFKARRQSIAK